MCELEHSGGLNLWSLKNYRQTSMHGHLSTAAATASILSPQNWNHYYTPYLPITATELSPSPRKPSPKKVQLYYKDR